MVGPGGPGQMVQDPINALQTLARQGIVTKKRKFAALANWMKF